jgi:hypothetical protein
MKHVKIYEEFHGAEESSLNEGATPAPVLAVAKKFQLGSRVIKKDKTKTYFSQEERIDANRLAAALTAAMAKNRIQLQVDDIYNEQYYRYVFLPFNPYIGLRIVVEKEQIHLDLESATSATYAEGAKVKKSDWFGGETYEDLANEVVAVLRENIRVITELQNMKDEDEMPASMKILVSRYWNSAKKLDSFGHLENVVNGLAVLQLVMRDPGEDRRKALEYVIETLEKFLKDKVYLEAPAQPDLKSDLGY